MIFYASNPDAISFTLELSMTLAHWRELDRQLPSSWPSHDLSRQIQDMIRQAEKEYYPQEPQGKSSAASP